MSTDANYPNNFLQTAAKRDIRSPRRRSLHAEPSGIEPSLLATAVMTRHIQCNHCAMDLTAML